MTGNKEKSTGKRQGFKPGVSGNPSGRPKKTAEEWDLINACKAKAPEALEVMVRIMYSGENERNQLSAAQAIIERGFGKAVQPTDIKLDGKLDITEIKTTIVDPIVK
jgi:hypothetical protein